MKGEISPPQTTMNGEHEPSAIVSSSKRKREDDSPDTGPSANSDGPEISTMTGATTTITAATADVANPPPAIQAQGSGDDAHINTTSPHLNGDPQPSSPQPASSSPPSPAAANPSLTTASRPSLPQPWDPSSGICWRCHLLNLPCTLITDPAPARFTCRKCRAQPDGPGYLRCQTQGIVSEVSDELKCLQRLALGTGNFFVKGVAVGGGGGNGGRRWHYRVNLTYRVVDGWRKVRDFKKFVVRKTALTQPALPLPSFLAQFQNLFDHWPLAFSGLTEKIIAHCARHQLSILTARGIHVPSSERVCPNFLARHEDDLLIANTLRLLTLTHEIWYLDNVVPWRTFENGDTYFEHGGNIEGDPLVEVWTTSTDWSALMTGSSRRRRTSANRRLAETRSHAAPSHSQTDPTNNRAATGSGPVTSNPIAPPARRIHRTHSDHDSLPQIIKSVISSLQRLIFRHDTNDWPAIIAVLALLTLVKSDLQPRGLWLKSLKEGGMAVEHVLNVLCQVFEEVVMMKGSARPEDEAGRWGPLDKGLVEDEEVRRSREEEWRRRGMEEWAVEGMRGWSGLWCEGLGGFWYAPSEGREDSLEVRLEDMVYGFPDG